MAEPLVCAGCALLCDDVEVELGAGAPGLTPACPVGEAWLAQRVAALDAQQLPEATLDGEATSLVTALQRAGELLAGARRPLLHGFAEATTEDARAAAALADRLGAIIASGPVDDPWPGGDALALRGASSATLGEIRDRARLVVIWREDPAVTHPRLLARLGFGDGATASLLEGERTLVVVDDRDTETAARADVRLRWPADEDLATLRWLLADRRGRAGDEPPPAGSQLSGLLLDAADHAAIIHGPGLSAGRGGQRRALALHELVRALDDDRHVVTLALAPAPGLRGADDVITWQTGYPGTVDLASGHPELVTSTGPIVAAESVDVAVHVGAGADAAALDGVSEIVVSPLPPAAASVWIRTAAPGIAAAGTAHRLDGVPLTLAAPAASPDGAPTAETVLARLREAVVS